MPNITLDGSGNGSVAGLPIIPGCRYILSVATELTEVGGTLTPHELTAAGFKTDFQASLSDPTPLAFDMTSSRGIRMEFVASGRTFNFDITGGTAALVVEYNLTPVPH